LGFIVVYDTKEKGVLYCPFHKTLQMYSISVRFYEKGDTRVCIVGIIGSMSKLLWKLQTNRKESIHIMYNLF